MAATKVPRTVSALQRWAFNMSGYNRYGLWHDDCLKDTPDVEEAIKRIPQDIRDQRNYRILRAFHTSMTHTTLPKHLWTKPEEVDSFKSGPLHLTEAAAKLTKQQATLFAMLVPLIRNGLHRVCVMKDERYLQPYLEEVIREREEIEEWERNH